MIPVPAFVSRAVQAWRAWRLRCVVPALSDVDGRIAAARRGHKPVRSLLEEKRRIVTERLRAEVAR